MLRQSVLCISLFLSTCAVEPSFAKIFPKVWNGKCENVSDDKYDKYHDTIDIWQHEGGFSWQKGRGYIPTDVTDGTEDIMTCISPPANGMGPK